MTLPIAASHGYSDIPDVVRVRINDKVETWTKLGHQYFSTNHPLYPWDPAVVRVIKKEIQETFVPCWVRNLYRDIRGNVQYFDRMVIAFYNEQKESSGLELHFGHLYRGSSDRGPRPNEVFDILEGPPIYGDDVPGAFIPGGWQAYQDLLLLIDYRKAVEEQQGNLSQDQITAAMVSRFQAKKAEQWASLKAAQDYKWDHDWDHSIVHTMEIYDQAPGRSAEQSMVDEAWGFQESVADTPSPAPGPTETLAPSLP